MLVIYGVTLVMAMGVASITPGLSFSAGDDHWNNSDGWIFAGFQLNGVFLAGAIAGILIAMSVGVLLDNNKSLNRMADKQFLKETDYYVYCKK